MIEFIRTDRCVGCELCVRVCPVDVFRLEPGLDGRPKAKIAYPDDCQTCFLCEAYCPVDAIYVNPQRGRLHAVGS